MIISIEDGTEIGGLASIIEDIIIRNNLECKFVSFAYPDEFIKHGSIEEIEDKYNISENAIARNILEKFICIDLVNNEIGWKPVYNFSERLDLVLEWNQFLVSKNDIGKITDKQINDFLERVK